MRKLLIFPIAFCFSVPVFSQQYWIQKGGGGAQDEAMDVSTDGAGNSYAAGYFTSSAQFGTTTLNPAGITDIFLTKLNSNGIYQWAVRAGGPGPDRALSVKTDAQGNSVVTGYYYNTANFGTNTVTSAGLQDIFIAKYDNTGNVLWVASAGGAGSDIGNAVNLDNNGNVVITGEFSGTSQFGTTTLTSMNGSIDVFTAKLDANGNFLWAKKGTAPYTDRGIDLACDANGNVFVTGQFTDTITFDITHLNNMQNAVFVIKYNSSGNEQWFRVIGGGSQNIANAIAVDAGNNVLLAGDFLGTITFFGSNSTLSNTYPNRIFLAKYDNSGTLLWNEADGSNDLVTARNLAVDPNGNPYVIGNFKCRFNEYADDYGQGTFNTVGFWDVFVTEHNGANGQWNWSRQLGGKKDNAGNGIAVTNNSKVIECGSFDENMITPVNGNFIGYNYTNAINTANFGGYCTDPFYSSFGIYTAAGGSDVFIGDAIDLNRDPYDFYARKGSGCTKSYEGVCINTSFYDTVCGPDTLEVCNAVNIYAITNTSLLGPSIQSIGPDFNYLWSTGATTRGIYITVTGNYFVTLTSADGCFTSQDTMYVIVHPNPPIPTITDNLGININATQTTPIEFCLPGQAILSAGNFNSNSNYYWTGPNGTTSNDSTTAIVSGLYCFYVTDQYGCTNHNCVNVIIDSLLPTIVPGMYCVQDSDRDDTINLCGGHTFTMYVFDTLSNPNGVLTCIPNSIVYWTATPSNNISFNNPTVCNIYTWNTTFTVTQPGLYTITAMLIRRNHCDTDTVYVTRHLYVNLFPAPPLTISGSPVFCPGDSTLLIAHGSLTYQWMYNNPNNIISHNDSIWVSQAGTYYVVTTNSYGCTTMLSIYVSLKPSPIVTMNPASGLLCPNDSVQLSCSGTGTFQWYGPNGPFGNNTSVVYGNTAGSYYCVLTDSTACVLVSNTVVLVQYTTPFLQPYPDLIICPNDSVIINVVTNAGSSVQWQSPLSGSNLTEIIHAPGTYSCMIISCGITTTVSVTITLSTATAQIAASGPVIFCQGSSVLLSGNAGMASYSWTPINQSGQNINASTSGTYTLTTTNADGCTATDTLTVDVLPNHLTPPVVADTFVCEGKSVTLYANGAPTIEWYYTSSGGTPFNTGNSFNTGAINSTTTYYLETQSGLCISMREPLVVTVGDCPLVIPNVFTPNGDGVNDLFTFHTEGMQSIHCKIYNRWGNLIYEWSDILGGWDGTNMHDGKKVSDGVYYYIADIEDLSGVVHLEHGFVQVLWQ